MYKESSQSEKGGIDYSRLLELVPGGTYRNLLEDRIQKSKLGRKVSTIVRRTLSQEKEGNV